MFRQVDSRPNFNDLENKLLKYWKDNKIFEKSISSRPENKKWNFVDGPPFITGLPHYGSLLSSVAKDMFPRFWTMKGYRVRRVWGWDCHGLPAENKVEEKLGLTSKKDIEEKVGIDKFIQECKTYVSEVSQEWDWYVDHIGRWADLKGAYRTMDKDYMESVMWVFKNIYDKGYIYKGLRVSLFCPHCSTPISNFEVAMDPENYKSVTEPSNVYKYKLEEEEETYILAWSTTPWNKLVTPALAVNPDLTYIKVKQGKEYYILAETTAQHILTAEKYEVVEKISGKKLVGRRFVPHYDFYKIDPGKKAFEIFAGDFVTADEGTGVVTIAAYGEDDLKLMKAENIQIVLHVDEEGHLKMDVPNWGGMYYLKVNSLVNADLAKRGLVYREDLLTHRVPTCWRCHTRLLYSPQNAWYMDVQKLKPQMEKTNEEVNWVPAHFKHGRFLKSMQSAPDWCISRSRYWGSPVPVWECQECNERYIPGSIEELEKMSGQQVKDLHRPAIDNVIIKCTKCGKDAKRVPEVLDSWIEAGSAPYAERHYPFDSAQNIKDFSPTDFVAEYTGQIRAWFYVLHVLSNALFGRHAFNNVVVTGVILGTDGRKMSKNYGNYPDPKELITEYGGDALRLYLLESNVMLGEDVLISEELYRNQVKGTLFTLWNVYRYFLINAELHSFRSLNAGISSLGVSVLDQWILSRLEGTKQNVTKGLEGYFSPIVVRELKSFISDLSTWYVRRSRKREDIKVHLSVLHHILVEFSKTLAPVTPFLAEEIYRNLTDGESVHLADWPKINKNEINEELIQDMVMVREIVEKTHSARKESQIKVRQPLNKLQITNYKLQVSKELNELITDELNVKNVEWVKGDGELSVELDTKITSELREEGEAREIIRNIQSARKTAGCKLDADVKVQLPTWPTEFEDEIKKQTLTSELIKGGELKIL